MMKTDLKLLIQISKKLTALYVEDHQETREEFEFLLDNIFGRVVVAQNGEEALEKFKQNDIDLIITDISMPQMDGIELIKRVRAINSDMKIVVFSAHENTKYLSECIDLGVDGFLGKPLNEEKYFRTLYKVADQIQTKKDLLEYEHKLEKKVEEQLKEIMLKNDILENHAKLAAMGEMIDIIAHQWKQPLNIIAIGADLAKELALDNGKYLEIEEVILCSDKVNQQVKHLTETLDHFRSFLRPTTTISEIDLDIMFESLNVLLKDQFIKNNIELKKEFDNIKFNANQNEIKHIFINLINNSKDAFELNGIKEGRCIKIKGSKENDTVIVKIKDNAGGIPEDIISNIFEANFTTKKDLGGTGIGLYMCKQIMNKINGTIEVQNIEEQNQKGSEFILRFPN